MGEIGENKPVKANVPPSMAHSRVMKWRKLRRSSLMVTVIGDKSYKKYTAALKTKQLFLKYSLE